MRAQQGFSLVELMVALAVLVILVTVAIPSFNSTILRMRGSAVADKLISSLNLARSEAISRNTRVTVCASSDGVDCDNSASNWNSGWIATWQDLEAAVGSQNKVIKFWRLSNQGATINLTPVNSHKLIYRANGEAFLSANGSTEVSPPVAIGFNTQVDRCEELTQAQRRVISIAPFGALTIVRALCQ